MTSDSDRDVSPPSTDLTRTIVDDQGRVWFVREMVVSRYDRRAAASLVFMSDEIIRRVRRYPADWHTLSDADLYAVSLHA